MFSYVITGCPFGFLLSAASVAFTDSLMVLSGSGGHPLSQSVLSLFIIVALIGIICDEFRGPPTRHG